MIICSGTWKVFAKTGLGRSIINCEYGHKFITLFDDFSTPHVEILVQHKKMNVYN